MEDIEQKELELQSHLERLEEQLLQQQQFATTAATSPTHSSSVVSNSRQRVTPEASAKYTDKFGKLLI